LISPNPKHLQADPSARISLHRAVHMGGRLTKACKTVQAIISESSFGLGSGRKQLPLFKRTVVYHPAASF
jgi:hypothetical protein